MTQIDSLSKIFNPKENSIGFLRLLSAILVVIAHSTSLGALGPGIWIEETNNQIALGRLPVDLFFALSGFLITASYLRLDSTLLFAWHRFLRIFPAYWVCIAFTGLVLPVLFGIPFDWQYVVYNFPLVTGIKRQIVGTLFEGNPHGPTANGALWTLPWECKAYLIIALFGITGLLKKKLVVAGVFLACWAYFIYIILGHPGIRSMQGITNGSRLLTFFLCGACFYLYQDRIIIKWPYALGCFIFLLLSLYLGNLYVPYGAGLYYIVAAIPFTYLVFWVAIALPKPFQKINVKYDFSYGIYIYGTLLLNVFTFMGLNKDFWSYNALTLAVTLIFSIFSWYVIEKPSLRLKDIWRQKRQIA